MIQNFIKKDIHDYSELIKSNKIQSILYNMPDGLTKLEKAYYVYLELGKILSENPKDVLTSNENRLARFGTSIDENYYGICLSICELYANVLKNSRIDIETDVIRRIPNKAVSHCDTVLKIDGKNYMTSLIRDLTNIKTNMRTKWFAFNLVELSSIRLNAIDKFAEDNGLNKSYIDSLLLEIRRTKDFTLIETYIQNLKSRGNVDFTKLYRLLLSVSHEQAYLNNIRRTYTSMTYLTKSDLENMDLKLGYCLGNSKHKIYTNDVLNKMSEEFKDNEVARKYILNGKHVPKSELLDYKMAYITENMHKFVEQNADLNYLEQFTSFSNFLSHFISPEESKRIEFYALKTGNTENDYVSLIKIKPYNEGNENNFYLYSVDKQKYEKKSTSELKEYISSLPPSHFQIIGKSRMYDSKLASLNTQEDIEDELLK